VFWVAGGNGYEDYLKEMKNEITKGKNSSFKDWLNG